ncbi:MAG: dipeptidase [Gemmatimonadota bacterium]|nr:dipeptidase [Gemmatimonadota bacterium]
MMFETGAREKTFLAVGDGVGSLRHELYEGSVHRTPIRQVVSFDREVSGPSGACLPHILLLALFTLGAAAVLALWLGPGLVTARLNPTPTHPSGPLAEEATSLHDTLRIVDLHSDALLWDTNLLEPRGRGHIDLPRLVKGRVAVQVFSVVTKVPRGVNLHANAGDSDQITALAMLQLWPLRTWRSPLQRALHQADRLRRTAARANGRLRMIESRSDLSGFLAGHAPGDGTVAGLLSLEGAHALEGTASNVDLLFEAGFRMIGLTHFFDNAAGGSAHGIEKGGLTDFGTRLLDRMDALGMLVDLAHASPALIDDVVARTTRPVVVSHTGVDGTCPSPRNLDDGRLEAITSTGGIIGIGLWPDAICGRTPADWARAVRYAADRVGTRHVALGSDWDGAVPVIVDASGTDHLVDALLNEGFTQEDVVRILGGNTLRVLRESLPR